MKKRIFVLYTGGTIGMVQTAEGLSPDAVLVGQALQPFADQAEFHWHVCSPLIDSSAVTLQNWYDWLEIIRQNSVAYDGILVLHGTDTMAYTANIFAMALADNSKPIVLTGSQWPYNVNESDAPLNLATAVAAFELPLRGVSIAFNGVLMRAVGSSKISTQTSAGFGNPHFGNLAKWSAQTGWQEWSNNCVIESLNIEQAPIINMNAKIVCHTLVPGFSCQYVSDSLAAHSIDAVILQSYGHGNAPADAQFIHALELFCEQGGLVLNISQVAQGCAAAVYAQGSALRKAGVINAGKCNLETATALLTVAVSNGWNKNKLEAILQQLELID